MNKILQLKMGWGKFIGTAGLFGAYEEGKLERALFRRKTCVASGGHPATGRCFVCVPEAEERTDHGKR